jgi:hypothetical protein
MLWTSGCDKVAVLDGAIGYLYGETRSQDEGRAAGTDSGREEEGKGRKKKCISKHRQPGSVGESRSICLAQEIWAFGREARTRTSPQAEPGCAVSAIAECLQGL